MQHRIDIHKDGTVDIIRDLGRAMRIDVIDEGNDNPVVEKRPITDGEFGDIIQKTATHFVNYDHHKKKLAFKLKGVKSSN